MAICRCVPLEEQTMLTREKRSAYIFVGIGVSLMVLTKMSAKYAWIDKLSSEWLSLFSIGYLLGVGLFLLGCMYYTAAKGYSKWLGLIAIIPFFGWVLLFVLKDNYASAKSDEDYMKDSFLPAAKYLRLAKLHEREQRWEEAEAAYRSALDLTPGDSQLLLGLGATLEAQGRNLEAVDAYRKCIASVPRCEEAKQRLSRLKP